MTTWPLNMQLFQFIRNYCDLPADQWIVNFFLHLTKIFSVFCIYLTKLLLHSVLNCDNRPVTFSFKYIKDWHSLLGWCSIFYLFNTVSWETILFCLIWEPLLGTPKIEDMSLAILSSTTTRNQNNICIWCLPSKNHKH